MTEQARKTRRPWGNRGKAGRARDTAYWARYAETLKVAGVAEGATNINVEGRRAVGPLQGFGQMWQKTYRVSLVGADVTPVEVIKTWKRITRTSGPRKPVLRAAGRHHARRGRPHLRLAARRRQALHGRDGPLRR